jgi:hypothetical protein
VDNLYKKQSAKYFQNRPSFMNVMVKNILVWFFVPHSVYIAEHGSAHVWLYCPRSYVDVDVLNIINLQDQMK